MELLIDTWNVLHQSGVLPAESAGIGISGLNRLIQQSRWRGEKITLVCDGTPSESAASGPRVQTIFTGSTRSADDEIMASVASSSSPRSILVITSDREIISSIRKRGAQQMGSSAFLQALVEDSHIPKSKKVHRPSGLSPKLAQEWKEHFGVDDGTLEELQNTALPEVKHEDSAPDQKPKPKKERTDNRDEPDLPADILEEARRLLEE